jgi:hypothetical protein
MTDSTGGWTRRRFLEVVGKAGGAAAVYGRAAAAAQGNAADLGAGAGRRRRRADGGL